VSSLHDCYQSINLLVATRSSIVEFESKVSGTSAKNVMDLLILNQYFDTLTQVGTNPNTKCVLLGSDVNHVRSGVMQANAGF
jgi:hypothetical protein